MCKIHDHGVVLSARLKAFPAAASLAALLSVAGLCADAHARSKGGKGSTEATGARAAQQIVAITNRERAKHGVPPLKLDRHCVSAITGHVADMARGGFMSHEGSDGRGAHERYRRYNPAGRGGGENVAYNTTGTAESFMRQWLASSGHRSNILSASYKGIGAAVRANCSSGGGSGGKCTYYAGQCFLQVK